MIAQAQAERPNECCGVLAGTIGADGIARVVRRYGLVNALASPTEYLWDGKGALDAARDMRRLGLEMIAIYHSHPTSEPIPSRTDRERYDEVRPLLGDVMHFIVGLMTERADVRAWWLTRDGQLNADWELL
jgi:proteasome lid subunit RPN8/RPN11